MMQNNQTGANQKKAVRKIRRRKSSIKVIGVVLVIVLVVCVAGVFLYNDTDQGEQNVERETQGILSEIFNEVPFLNESVNDDSGIGGYSISSSCELATKAGAEILDEGGNAVDAAIAISYALSVAEPFASGLGGGGCMMIYNPQTQGFYFYNYASEAAQSGASRTILVPGMVSGMDTIREDFASMDYEQLLRPAMELCDGFVVGETLARRISSLSTTQTYGTPFYGTDGYIQEGEMLVQEELKQTLQTIITDGAQSFYTGSLAQEICDQTPFTMEDLAVYETIQAEPVVGSYYKYQVASAAAPYSGVSLIQMLRMTQALNTPSPDTDNAEFLRDLKKVTQAVMVDRQNNVYDHRFGGTQINQNDLVSNEYIANLLGMDLVDFIEDEECEDTTGFTVVDQNGMIVACTNTLSGWFGCRTYVEGFFLNNSGTLFGTGVNAYGPGKRPRTHISPAIAVSEDECHAIASPGGHVIFRTLANVLMDVCAYDTQPQLAVDKQRLFFMNGNTIYYEIGYDTPSFATVPGAGYPCVPYSSHTYFGCVALCGYDGEDGYYATADIRRDGYGVAVNE